VPQGQLSLARQQAQRQRTGGAGDLAQHV
jgi:hypothetical protein